MKKPRNFPKWWKQVFPKLDLKMKFSILFLLRVWPKKQANLKNGQGFGIGGYRRDRINF